MEIKSPTTLKAPSTVLMGPPGAGKTDSIITLLEAGIETFVVVTEPNGLDSLLDSAARRKIPLDLLHWHVVSPTAAGWSGIKDMAKTIGSMSYSAIADLKSGVGKQHVKQMNDFLECFENFTDDRTGEIFGDVTTWDDSRALVLDSLSGLNKLAKEHTVGFKPSMHQGEWGIAMNLEEAIIYKLASDCMCYFVVIAHIDRTPIEATGGTQVSMAALGNKLAPQLVKLFSEVVLAKREKDKFLWSTMESGVDVKNRALPISDHLSPSFSQIVATHKQRRAAIVNKGATPTQKNN